MATIIENSKSSSKERKPILIDRVDGFNCEIFDAFLLPNESGFISTSDDR